MKNSFLFSFKSRVVIKVKGSNLNRFIKRLKDHNINIYKIKYSKNNDYIILTILKKDLDLVLKIKTIYEINIINYLGFYKLKNDIKINRFLLILILLALITIYILSSMIFDIEVITNDQEMKEELIKTLNDQGISKYRLKKDYNSLIKIKTYILNKYKDKIEWLEIESRGTSYIIRYEPRIINNSDSSCENRNIIALKDATIYDVDAESGVIVKEKNTYVKKGDIIVSGTITLNDTIKNVVCAKGNVLGEVWYKVSVTYPLTYYEEQETGNSKKILTLKIFNKEFQLFNFKHYKYKKIVNETILKNNLLPIKLSIQKQKELSIIDENNSLSEAKEKAIALACQKIEDSLSSNEFILNYKVINESTTSDSISLIIFYSVIEDITDFQSIVEEPTQET
jgi:similar to stage IV sporulation protein